MTKPPPNTTPMIHDLVAVGARGWSERGYYCHCVHCDQMFVGYKRQVRCRLCEEASTQTTTPDFTDKALAEIFEDLDITVEAFDIPAPIDLTDHLDADDEIRKRCMTLENENARLTRHNERIESDIECSACYYEKTVAPMGSERVEAYKRGNRITVIGDPDWNGEGEEDHNCDAMGCGFDHVVAIIELDKINDLENENRALTVKVKRLREALVEVKGYLLSDSVNVARITIDKALEAGNERPTKR